MKKDNSIRFDRVPPQDVDAERSLLGSMIEPASENRDNIALAIKLGVIPEIFYRETHQELCMAIYNLYDAEIPIDLVSLAKNTKNIELAYIDELIDSTPTSKHLAYYAKIVQQEALRRAIIQRAVDLYNASFDPSNETNYLIKQHKETLDNIHELYSGNMDGKTGYTAKELEGMDFPEPEWIVKDYVPYGLSMLAGSPKMGKSFWTLDLAIAVATDGYFLGQVKVDNHGSVLYLALEDTFRRVKSRLNKTIPEGDYPSNLEFWTDIPKFNAGGMAKLEAWKKETQNPKLIIIDVFQKIRDIRDNRRNSNAYEDDYEELGRIKRFADKSNVAILCVHHTRKADASDFVDTLNGSTALAGAVDGALVIKRERGSADAVLHRTGKDYEETDDIAMKFDLTMGGWRILGNADDYKLSQQRMDIMKVLEDSNDALTPKQISDLLDGINVKMTLRRMVLDGQIKQFGYGKYVINYKNEQK